MSGGRLVVLDRLGRDVKAFPLEEGLATIGSDPVCDIRVMLPTVSPHHATVVVHTNQTIVRSESAGETLVNDVPVSVAALRHNDELTVGGRILRWEYNEPNRPRPLAPQPALVRRAGRARSKRRGSEPASRALLTAPHRASMPSSSSGKQVAIVQPQRRDTNDQQASRAAKRPRNDAATDDEVSSSSRKSTPRSSPKPAQETTKATLWIESRKPTPRRSAPRSATPLRLAVLRRSHAHSHTQAHSQAHTQAHSRSRAHSHTPVVTKIQAPAKIDHTKQAAIMLMTGHTPKAKQPSPRNRPSLVVKKPNPVKTPKRQKSLGVTPKRASLYASRSSVAANKTATILEITDSDTPNTRQSNISRRTSRKTPLKSPVLSSPKKSSLKDPSAKKSTRKTESIKFDLSNLASDSHDRSSDVVAVANSTEDTADNSASEDDLSLHYSDTSIQSPSPRKSIHSRSSKILEKSLGTSFIHTSLSEQSTLTSESPRARKSLRGSLIVQKALENSDSDSSRYSRRSTKTMSDQSYNTVTSARKTRTLSPRSSRNMEAYSIVDLVSIDSRDSQRSIYNSADSVSTSANYDTPQTLPRKTRSTNLLGSSTPYTDRPAPTNASPETSKSTIHSISRVSTRRSASLTTPKNSQNVTFNSTKISKSRSSRSRINDSDVLLVDDDNESPRSSRRNKSNISTPVPKNISISVSANSPSGAVTPENRRSPQEATTPVLSIQSLLDQSGLGQSESVEQSQPKTRRSLKRKTIAGNISETKKTKLSIKSRSLNMSSRRSLRARKLSTNSIENNEIVQDDEAVTPKSAVKLVQEAVKNKHSTAKKPTSKRSIIDNLNESDFVKQLFNSPVKRKLSQSMTEFSRKQLYEDENMAPQRHTRHTTALTGRTPDNSLLNDTEAYTPEVFVSPLSSPGNSPNLSGIRRLFRKDTPENDLRNVRGVKALLRTPRNRKSVKNDLTNVSGVKRIFGKSPRNRLSDVRIKEVFVVEPNNDLKRVSGVKALFQTGKKGKAPKNTLEDVRGVKNLFKKSPLNDLRNVSGVKKALRVNSPRNDLTDVRGVKQLYREQENRNNLSDVSGVEELFYESSNLDSTFDQLMGKPRVRAYGNAQSFVKVVRSAKKDRNAKSLNDSIGQITNNVEQWLESELKKRVELKEAKKVPAEHTLPLKKRSVAAAGEGERNSLPLKKRAVVHSTPLKGAPDASAINASGLGPVSPIAPLRTTPRTTPRTAHGNMSSQHESLRQKPNRSRKGKNDLKSEAPTKPSPKNTRGKSAQPSSMPVRATRGRRTKDISLTNSKKRRSSIVITKKVPALAPKADSKTKKKAQIAEKREIKSPTKPKAIRAKPESQPEVNTPKKTRGRKVSLVLSKASPKLKPRTTRTKKKESSSPQVQEVQTRRSRKVTVNTTNDKNATENKPEEAPKRGRKPNPVEAVETKEPVKRGRRKVTLEEPQVKESNKGRKTRVNAEIQTNVAVEPEKSTNRRTRRTQEKIEEKMKEVAPTKKTRKTQEKTEKSGKKEVIVDTKEKSTRGRKAKISVLPEVKGNVEKDKATKATSDEGARGRSRRGAKAEVVLEDEPTGSKGKGKKDTRDKDENVATRRTRKAVKEIEVKEVTRGKKNAPVKEMPKSDTEKGQKSRKRKTPVEEPAADVAAVPKRRRGATALTQTEAVEAVAPRRSRRR